MQLTAEDEKRFAIYNQLRRRSLFFKVWKGRGFICQNGCHYKVVVVGKNQKAGENQQRDFVPFHCQKRY